MLDDDVSVDRGLEDDVLRVPRKSWATMAAPRQIRRAR
jgi:hypothetical protein